MHELSVTQSILDIVLQHAKERKVRQVNLVIGQFSSIVDDSVQFYWEIIAKDRDDLQQLQSRLSPWRRDLSLPLLPKQRSLCQWRAGISGGQH